MASAREPQDDGAGLLLGKPSFANRLVNRLTHAGLRPARSTALTARPPHFRAWSRVRFAYRGCSRSPGRSMSPPSNGATGGGRLRGQAGHLAGLGEWAGDIAVAPA